MSRLSCAFFTNFQDVTRLPNITLLLLQIFLDWKMKRSAVVGQSRVSTSDSRFTASVNDAFRQLRNTERKVSVCCAKSTLLCYNAEQTLFLLTIFSSTEQMRNFMNTLAKGVPYHPHETYLNKVDPEKVADGEEERHMITWYQTVLKEAQEKKKEIERKKKEAEKQRKENK